MMCGNLRYLSSLSGVFRLLTVICGIPTIILAWVAYFSSSWAKTFPEILTILAVEKQGLVRQRLAKDSRTLEPTSEESASSSTVVLSTTPLDLISDKEEEYMDEILMQTLMYEKFFIGLVSVVFLMSTAYLILRVIIKHQPDSPYEIMFDFIFHVLSALGLLTGSALILLSAAKIQSFVDQVTDESFNHPQIPYVDDDVQDKADKIAAAVIAMLNGILYALCVVTIRMTSPIQCRKRDKPNHLYVHPVRERNDNCRYPQSGLHAEPADSVASYGFYGNAAYFGE